MEDREPSTFSRGPEVEAPGGEGIGGTPCRPQTSILYPLSSIGLPLVEELTPLPDPLDACRRLAHLPYLLLLDSAARDSSLGRYSFVTADPFSRLRSKGPWVWVDGAGPRRADPFAVPA